MHQFALMNAALRWIGEPTKVKGSELLEPFSLLVVVVV
jgi:hypothetical protein